MPRPKNPVPNYSKHPHNNTARCWLNGRWVTLGRYDSPESRAEFARVCAEVAATSDPAAAARSAPKGATVAELIAAFKSHVEQHHRRPDGTPTKEVDEYKQALRVLRRLYGHTPAAKFGPVALQTVRAEMIRPPAEGGLGWCRSRTNKQVGRVRRCFKWGVAQELVPAATWTALGAVGGLRRGRSAARETKPVGPVPDADYARTLPAMVPTLRAMVELQRLAGLRPEDVRHLTPADVDRSEETWMFRPTQHKMEHLGRPRVVPLSPSARAVLESWLEGKGADQTVFTPAAAREEMYAVRRSRRKSKVTPSQLSRRKPAETHRKKWSAVFTDFGYAKAVRRACLRAGVPPWAPNQLRHAFGTEVRDRFGLDVAQVLLGHAHASVTQVYAEKTLAKAVEAAKALG